MSLVLYSPNTTEAYNSIVHSLIYHRQGDESETFSRRAIESLVKKLKERSFELETLVTTIGTNGAQPSCCVTIPRTLDGRLQIAGRKGFPHVVYARIWRWPGVHRNDLPHLPCCRFAYEIKADVVCVNPYHYQRVTASSSDLLDDSGDHCGSKSLEMATEDFSLNNSLVNTDSILTTNKTSPDLTSGFHSVSKHSSPKIDANKVMSHSALTISSPRMTLSYIPQMQPPPADDLPPISIQNLLSAVMLPAFWCSISYYEQDVQVGEPFKASSLIRCVTVDGFVDPSANSRFCLGALTHINRTDRSMRTRLHIGKGVQLELKESGDVWLRCRSEHSVFLQSFYLDSKAGFWPGYVALCYSEKTPTESVSLDPAEESFCVDDLRQFCILRLSFVKGWGPDYTRSEIKETPCWIEVHLNSALELLDKALHNISAITASLL